MFQADETSPQPFDYTNSITKNLLVCTMFGTIAIVQGFRMTRKGISPNC